MIKRFIGYVVVYRSCGSYADLYLVVDRAHCRQTPDSDRATIFETEEEAQQAATIYRQAILGAAYTDHQLAEVAPVWTETERIVAPASTARVPCNF